MKRHQHPALVLLAMLACAPMICAQTKPSGSGAKASAQAATTLQPSVPRVAPSLLTHPAQPAKITLSGGKLTIRADNSTLSGILGQISHDGGMKVVGLESGNAAQRIFGSYGPGAPRKVLSSLLNGAGYNVLMLGASASGAPQTLTLSARPTGGVPNPPPSAAPQYNPANNYNYRTVYPKPKVSPPPPPPHPNAAQRVRTPQQMLQELEQMRHRQPNQQTNSQN